MVAPNVRKDDPRRNRTYKPPPPLGSDKPMNNWSKSPNEKFEPGTPPQKPLPPKEAPSKNKSYGESYNGGSSTTDTHTKTGGAFPHHVLGPNPMKAQGTQWSQLFNDRRIKVRGVGQGLKGYPKGEPGLTSL